MFRSSEFKLTSYLFLAKFFQILENLYVLQKQRVFFFFQQIHITLSVKVYIPRVPSHLAPTCILCERIYLPVHKIYLFFLFLAWAPVRLHLR